MAWHQPEDEASSSTVFNSSTGLESLVNGGRIQLMWLGRLEWTSTAAFMIRLFPLWSQNFPGNPWTGSFIDLTLLAFHMLHEEPRASELDWELSWLGPCLGVSNT